MRVQVRKKRKKNVPWVNYIVVLSTVLVYVFSIADATPGIATFYTSYTPSACYGVKCNGAPNAVPHPCTGKSVTVKIVDHCPGGCPSTLDLSREAFAQIANPVAGIINIDYFP
ncbi:putative EG45-like domain containing protein 1 [Cardamine amara subsp. amara]|uniref:EG45-like domain containing protein 1 n=1 Tax=Cardamine amara subsp. amara TaxID=228776 RepID=A0ABD1AWM7_CARAN